LVRKIEARKKSRQAAKTKIETFYCPDQDGAFRIERVAHAEGAGQDADCTRWPDDAQTIYAHAPDYSSHADAYWNATFQEELARWVPSFWSGLEPEPDEYSYEELDDLRLAVSLLTGEHGLDENDRPTKRYLTPDKEFVARKALVRLLRSPKPLDSALRRQLAALFDPETETPPFSSFDSAPMELRVVIKARHRGGGKIQRIRKIAIAIEFEKLIRDPADIRDKVLKEIVERFEIKDGISRDDALAAIAERFQVSTRIVEDYVAQLKTITSRW
jgi:hypothetical protein